MQETSTYFIITEGGQKHLLPVTDIVHVQAVRIYSVFHMRGGGQQFVSTQNLGKVIRQLDPQQFLRIHKSHIVNLHEITSCQLSRGGKVTLSDNSVIEVAQRRKTQLLRHLHHVNKQLLLKKKNAPRAAHKVPRAK